MPVLSHHRALRCCAPPQAEVPLLKPDILVCSVGTEILLNGAQLKLLLLLFLGAGAAALGRRCC